MRILVDGALEEVISCIENLNEKSVLDIFARQGDWNSHIIYSQCLKMECWEIDEKFREKLKSNLPKCEIKIMDSIQTINNYNSNKKYDILFIDNSLGIYGKNQYCEHFDFLGNSKNLLREGGYLIFNVNIKPFEGKNYEKYIERRSKFYGVDSKELSLDFMLDFYKKVFNLKSQSSIKAFPREKINNKVYLYFFLLKME